MPTYLTPGVYVEEVSSGKKPIEGVGTAVAAFVGLAPGGPVNVPMQVSNWSQFARIYGDTANPDNGPFMPGAYLAHSVYGYFQNGGSLCWVVRVGAEENGKASARAALPAATDRSVEALRAVALDGAGDPINVEISEEETPPEGDPTYKVVITAGPEREEYGSVSLRKGRTYIATKVNAESKLIKIEDTGATLPDVRLAPGKYALQMPSAAPSEVKPADFEGDVGKRRGMGGLAAIDEITMIAMPDMMQFASNGGGARVRDLQGKMIAHCEGAGERMAILDCPPDLSPQEVYEWRMNTAGYDSKMAALYYPWIEVMDPLTRRPITIPPSGHVAGVWARVDQQRGVHKAPANEVVMGANGLGFQVTHAEQGSLNKNGVNCIRAFPGRGIRIWGARTLSSDPEWRYINVRRLFNFVSESVITGTQWSVFEPNDPFLWTSLSISVSNFLRNVWRSGALFGATPGEAFYVKCDAETNPPEVVEAGRVICEIGIAPVKPAEFVIFRLSQFTGGGAPETAEGAE
ncbi:MAG TPA: phage tail sheath subtilisin-like domain-containing protein [Solirubrobacteraceae bacterium]|nr:phage tail sheath subtilisin-like domain-containing protein [Solirubrobacteraceae bacterium]